MKLGDPTTYYPAVMLLGVASALTLASCRVHVDKDANGKEKTVQVDTPFGGVHVNNDQVSAADLGLPVYPGAEQVKNDDKHESADVHIGFGDWQLRVKVVSYETPDSKDKIAAFYKKALTRYGDVISCQGSSPVGTPAVTHEGLTCDDDMNNKKQNVKVDDYNITHDFQLKAGSKRHQHIVGIEDAREGRTKFALVALDLPANLGHDDSSKE
jgi:hypothetical protein